MALRTSSFTVQMDYGIKHELNEYCDREGYKLNKFIENAVKNEMARRRMQADQLSYANYLLNEKAAATDLCTFAESIGVKTNRQKRFKNK